jgi:hypothetical protein
VIPLWRDRCVVSGEPAVPVILTVAEGEAVIAAAAELVFLGFDDRGGIFAADLSQAAEPSALEAAGGERVLDLRTLVGTLTPAEAALLATRGESCTGTAISSTAAAAGPRPASVTAGTSGPAGTRHAAACTSRGSSPR